jgi:hypothetical protein
MRSSLAIRQRAEYQTTHRPSLPALLVDTTVEKALQQLEKYKLQIKLDIAENPSHDTRDMRIVVE